MKILHTADLHFGKIIYGRSMIEDQEYFVSEVLLPALRENRPDCVVISGDVFDRAVAPLPALTLFDRMITEISGENISLIIIPGNHDGAERMAMGARLMKSAGVYIITALEDCQKPIIITDSDGVRTAVHALPFFDPATGKAFLGVGEIMGYDQIFAGVVDSIDVSDRSLRHILAAHCTVLGAERSGGESGAMVGGSDQVPMECFDKFDFTLLGHLHSAQSRGGKIAYSGAPLRYSFEANERDKSMNLLDIKDDGITLHKIGIKPLREMRYIEGNIDDITAGIGVPEPSGDYYFAELTDRELVYEPMARLRERYPNVLGMRYSNREPDEDEEGRAGLREKLRDRSLGDAEVLTAFLRQMCGTSPEDGQRELFLRLCAAVDKEDAV